jgi:hypothetical protein
MKSKRGNSFCLKQTTFHFYFVLFVISSIIAAQSLLYELQQFSLRAFFILFFRSLLTFTFFSCFLSFPSIAATFADSIVPFGRLNVAQVSVVPIASNLSHTIQTNIHL